MHVLQLLHKVLHPKRWCSGHKVLPDRSASPVRTGAQIDAHSTLPEKSGQTVHSDTGETRTPCFRLALSMLAHEAVASTCTSCGPAHHLVNISMVTLTGGYHSPFFTPTWRLPTGSPQEATRSSKSCAEDPNRSLPASA